MFCNAHGLEKCRLASRKAISLVVAQKRLASENRILTTAMVFVSLIRVGLVLVRIRVEELDNLIRLRGVGFRQIQLELFGLGPFLVRPHGLAKGHASVFPQFHHVLEAGDLIAELLTGLFGQCAMFQIHKGQKVFAISALPALAAGGLVQVQPAAEFKALLFI